MLDDLPPRVIEDPDVRAVTHCFARESARARIYAGAVRDAMIPNRVSTTKGAEFWEYLYRLPAPGAMTVAQRRDRIVARHRQTAPRVASSDFREDMNALIGSGSWSFEEDWPAIRVKVPFDPGSDAFLALEDQIRNLQTFPCHLDLILENEDGFVLDQSQLDQEPFHPA